VLQTEPWVCISTIQSAHSQGVAGNECSPSLKHAAATLAEWGHFERSLCYKLVICHISTALKWWMLWNNKWKINCLIEIISEYSWKISFARPKAAQQESVGEVSTFIIFLCQVSSGCVPQIITRSSADADNRLDAFSGQSRSTNMVPCHMFPIVQ